jgi:tetratricopeptide (TPR) repeat protein
MMLTRYEDASRHLTYCLKVLHDRRVHLPAVRIRAHTALALTCVMRGLYQAGVQQYEEALRLCGYYQEVQELPAIHYELCEAYYRIEAFAKADLAGQEAARLYHELADYKMEACALYALGRVSYTQKQYATAADYYRQALHLACQHQYLALGLKNQIALADLATIEKRLDEAKQRREKILRLAEREETELHHLRGEAYLIVGKTVQEEAQTLADAQREMLLRDAASWYEKAAQQKIESWESVRIAEVYQHWAQVLEQLGRTREALKCWHFAYGLLALQDDPQSLSHLLG